MRLGRRELIAGAAITVGGCVAPQATGTTQYEGTDRVYTCSYDATVAGISPGEQPEVKWREPGFHGQARDILPDNTGHVLVVDDRGLHKLKEYSRTLDHRWSYTRIDGSVRGITIDRENDYYVGSWSAGQGFHKVSETSDGLPAQEWVYHWEEDNGMITAAADPDKRLALALKNGEVHLIEEEAGQPVRRWAWNPGTDEIMREVLWDGHGHLYVASEDHQLYKLEVPDHGEPELRWQYDAGNILFGAAITPQGDIYVATNDGAIHCVEVVNGSPTTNWVYQHTDTEDDIPTDSYHWDGLAHQVAVRPDAEETKIYSCSYGDNTVHRIEEVDGEPENVWEFEGHTDYIREVRVHGEHVGTTPEAWGIQ